MNPSRTRRVWPLRIGVALTAVTLLGCQPSGSGQKDGRWAAFNGFYPGMSLQEAKAAGARDCKETSAISKEIRCTIPPERLGLGPWIAKEGHMDFYVRHGNRLSRIWLYFQGPHFNAVCQAATKAYGPPVNGVQYVWRRAGTPALIRGPKWGSSGDSSRSFLEFQFEPKLAIESPEGSFPVPRGCLDPD